MAKNISQTIKNNKDIVSYSETFRAFGLDWSLGVETSKKDDTEYVGIYLFIGGNFSKE